MTVGFNTIFPKLSTSFIVKNIAKNGKTVRVFAYPILNGQTRDLLAIPYVSEADIRHSLLKGELQVKLESEELFIDFSDIDLLQFNDIQKAFLMVHGITTGVVPATGDSIIFKQDVNIIGTQDSFNVVFTVPEKFLYTTLHKLTFYINGVRQAISTNFMIAESGGVGTGYDTIICNEAPDPQDILLVDYYPA